MNGAAARGWPASPCRRWSGSTPSCCWRAASHWSWRAAGVFLPTNPHGSFFYLLTAVHGVHVLAGLAALVVARARPAVLGLCAAFWHLMGAVWVYVLFVLTVL